MKIDPYLFPFTKLTSKWIKDFNTKPYTLNLIEEEVGKSLELIGTGGNFLNRNPMAHALWSSIEKWCPTSPSSATYAAGVMGPSMCILWLVV